MIACGLATKLNKCRWKSRVIFTAAARILIFTAQVGLIVQCICILCVFVYFCIYVLCIFTTAAGILIFTAEVGLIVRADPLPLKRTSLYKSVTHLRICICTFFTGDPPPPPPIQDFTPHKFVASMIDIDTPTA